MNREKIIAEVKNEYARLVDSESQEHVRQTTTNIPPEAFYENLLSKAISEINKGTYDKFNSGAVVVTAIANDRS